MTDAFSRRFPPGPGETNDAADPSVRGTVLVECGATPRYRPFSIPRGPADSSRARHQMMDEITPNQGKQTHAGDSESGTPGARPVPIGTRLLLLGGGLMASWGALVTVALAVVLVIQGPGPGGPVPFLLGGFVIGLAPIGLGAILFQLGRQRLRQTRAEDTRRGGL